MRIVRSVALAVAGSALIPSLIAAQAASSDSFEHSWFWGARAGVGLFKSESSGARTSITAPSVGAEWLITGTKVALSLSFDQSFFGDKESAIVDPTVAGGARDVIISNMRRYQIGLLVFPKAFGALRPYGGAGIGISALQNVQPLGTYASPASQDSILKRVNRLSSHSAAVFTLGVQSAWRNVSLFGQGSVIPTGNGFLLNGASDGIQFEAGVRYRVSGLEKFF